MRQASGLTQDLVDSAAAISARPAAVQDLIDAMTKLSGSYHEVEAMLNEIQELLKVITTRIAKKIECKVYWCSF